MKYVIQFAGQAGGIARADPGAAAAAVGAFVREYWPEAHDGRGEVVWTYKLSEAKKFDTYQQAVDVWRAVPKNRPKRPDGKPNRPLTTFSVVIAPAMEAFGDD